MKRNDGFHGESRHSPVVGNKSIFLFFGNRWAYKKYKYKAL